MTSSLPCGQTSLLLQMTERLALSDAHFRRISQLIYQRAGIVLADHKRDMVYNRLVRRLRSLGLTDFGHYLNLLESNQHSGEWQAFINSLTTNLTAFFREAHHFPLLADHARRRSGEYRVWSAAASTGEEPYSIAMTLDVEMPRMDGLDFLEKLMRLRPMPVVMVSSLTGKGSEVTLRALELGAIDFVTKPQLGIREGMLAYSEMIAEKVRTAAKASLAAHKPLSAPTTLKAGPLLSSEKLIAIGASTGGTEAIRHVLQPLPLSSPALLITQHMPPGFTRSFADRLNKLCQIGVKEAEDGERVLPGHAYIAPGDRHMELSRSGANYQIKIHDGPAVNRHRPSVDVLFHSVAKQAGRNAVGVILTGMGNDGAAGMLAMRQAGAWTLAQNEASCVVFGMPREAINMGGVCEVVDLSQVSQQMLAKISAGQAIRI